MLRERLGGFGGDSRQFLAGLIGKSEDDIAGGAVVVKAGERHFHRARLAGVGVRRLNENARTLKRLASGETNRSFKIQIRPADADENDG